MINKAEIDGNGNIVIQDADNSVITINANNPLEIRKFFIDFQNKLSELPKNILEIMESKNSNSINVETGANVHLSLNYMMTHMGVNGITFSVTITNLTKENRFFNAPFFKISVPIDGGVDTFVMTDTINKIIFPKKIEYGELVTEVYHIRPQSKEIYTNAIAQNGEATIQVIVSTTIGEIYKSNEYKVSKLLENFKFAK